MGCDTVCHGSQPRSSKESDLGRATHKMTAICKLPVVERNLASLIHLSFCEFCSTGNTAPVFAPIGQINPLFAQCIEQGRHAHQRHNLRPADWRE